MANITYVSIIDAIKAIRSIPVARVETYRNAQGELCISERGMGLKEAKDITEAIMALGVRRYLADELAKANVATTYVGDDIRF